MGVVTISPTFQVVIPRAAREHLQLAPGQHLRVLVYDDRIELIPSRDVRWFLKGIGTTVDRDAARG